MKRRETWTVVVLTYLTCGVYGLYWQYVTTDELKSTTDRDDLNPLIDLLITLLCCGVWAIYVQYRNAQVVHASIASRGLPHEDRSQFILIMHLLTVVTGITGIIAMAVLQDEYNRLADQDVDAGL